MNRLSQQATPALRPAFPPIAARTDVPAEVAALASRLGVPARRDIGSRVNLTQSGTMCSRPGGPERAFRAEQTVGISYVGFVWRARTTLLGPIGVEMTDYLEGDEAGLEARLLGLIRLARAPPGVALSRGEAMRYLAELIWNPDAILFNRDIDWRVLDAHRLTAATGTGERRCEIGLWLDSHGLPHQLAAEDRPRMVGRRFETTPWFGRCHDYQWLANRRIPRRAEVGWRIDGREFVYFRAHLDTWSMT